MPVTKSATKALRKDLRRKKINQKIRLKIKKAVKLAHSQPSWKNIQSAYSALDKAAKKKVIHKNKASRLKSKLAKLLKKGSSKSSSPVKSSKKTT